MDKKVMGLQLFQQGMSLTKIEKEIGITRQTLAKYIKSQGIEIGNPAKKYNYDENYFSVIDTEEKAYWLGFIYADGCINELRKTKTLEICLKDSDKSHLEKFALSIGGSLEQVKEKVVKLHGKEIMTYRIAVCSTKLCNDLETHGVTARKSLTLAFPKNIDESMLKHFIRGYFDGDGCISYNGKRKRISIIGTENFLNDLSEIFSTIGATPTKLLQDKRSHAVTYEKAGEGAEKILDYLYSDSTIYLDRKYELANAVLRGNSQNDKCEIKRGSGKVVKTRNTNRSIKRKFSR